MKTRIIFCFFFLVFMFTNVNAYEIRPLAVSPGSESGIAVVRQDCPTFSWSEVQGAEAYRVMVFKAVGRELLTYEEMDTVGYTVMNKEIRGPALSWTPSGDERLNNGEAYVWYVQAVDAYGVGIWSEGKMFVVVVAERLAGVEEKVRDRLREYGVSEETTSEVLKDFKSGIDAQGIGYMIPGQIVIQGTEDGLNTFYGKGAGSKNTGNYNAFFGSNAGASNTTGSQNSFIGANAGNKNTKGIRNTFMGNYAGYKNITGNNNSFIGASAGYYNTTGGYNTFLGDGAGYKNTTGSQNSFIGLDAGNNNTTGKYNTFIGNVAGYKNTSGYENTFMGNYAGYNNTKGKFNTFIGNYAGRLNTTGKYNTFIGYEAGFNNFKGDYNNFFGNYAGHRNAKGKYNTFIGNYAGFRNTNGSKNIFLGQKAGYYETGSNKLYIDNSDTVSPLIYGRFDTNIVIINGKLGVGRNPIYLIDVTGGAYCNGTTWINSSSREYKENIESLDTEEAMEALDGLKPVKFKYKRNKEEEHVGFIAEDVPDLVATKGRKGMSAMDVVAVLTKVVQEQQRTISELKEMIVELKAKK